MTARPTETKRVAALLVEGADTPEALAKTVIDTVDAMRAERDQWIVVNGEGHTINGYGPYPTVTQCMKAVDSGRLPLPYKKTFVARLVHPSRAGTLLEEA